MAQQVATEYVIQTQQGYLVVDPKSAWIAAVTIKPMATKFKISQNMICVSGGPYNGYYIGTNTSGCVCVRDPNKDKGYYEFEFVNGTAGYLKSARNDTGFKPFHNKPLTYYPSNGYFYFHDIGSGHTKCNVKRLNA